MRKITKEKWRRSVIHWATEAMIGRSHHARVVPNWLSGRNIRVMWEDGIREESALIVKEAIERLAGQVGLKPFDIQLWGTGWATDDGNVALSDYIKPALLPGRRFDLDKLLDLSHNEEYRQWQQHADVYLINQYFHDKPDAWGASVFEFGCIVMTLGGKRQSDRDFLGNVAQHEAGHFLGMPIHCDALDVEDYEYDSACNMHYACETRRTCEKCLDFLRTWWQVVEVVLANKNQASE